MNLPSATTETAGSHPRCVADITVPVDSIPTSVSAEIEVSRARSAVGDGDITLSVVTTPEVPFWFKGLYLALFTRA